MADSLSTDSTPDVNLSAAEDVVALALSGLGGVAFQVIGTYSGTITFEGTVNGGVWAAMVVVPIGTTAGATTTTSTGIFRGSSVGLQQVRARMSSYSSGYATVTIRACSASWVPVLS